MDAVIAALYDVISGPAGKKRDWNRMRSLFIPEGRLIATARRTVFGLPTMEVADQPAMQPVVSPIPAPQMERGRSQRRELLHITS